MKYERFVQVESGIVQSKLVDRCREVCGVSTNEAIGLLVRLWIGALRLRTRGYIGERSNAWIEEEAGWRGQAGVFGQFIRDNHLDAHGVIRDWLSKYGKLDLDRDKRADVKRRQRQSHGPSTGQSTRPSTGQSRDSLSDSHESSSSSSSSLSVAGNQEQGQENREPSRERVADPLDFTLAEAGLDLSGFAETDRAVIEGALRASRSPLARAVVLANALKEHPPVVVGRAFREYVASEQPWSTRLFGGFLRDAAKQVQVGDNRERTKRETQHIDREAVEAERARREEAEVSELLADFERTQGEEFERLKVQAEASVDRKWSPMVRAPMVRAALVKLIRGRNNGTR